MYLVEDKTAIPCNSCMKILICETILQFFVSILSLWWISGVPTCIHHLTGFNRRQHAYIWSVLFVIVFIAHLIQWKMTSKEMYKIVRGTYSHLETEV